MGLPVTPCSIRSVVRVQSRSLVAMLPEREVRRRVSSDIFPEALHVAR